MPQCSDCSRLFRNLENLHVHCRDRADHIYCVDCKRLFVDSNALQQHTISSPIHQHDDEEGGSSEDDDESAFCRPCKRSFGSRISLHQHLASPKHNWCFICSRDFASASALDQHSSSRVHRGRDMKCPLCSKAFKIPSAIALHIESGACHNINRRQVTAAIHSLAITPTISISHRLHAATTTASPKTITHYSATEQAFNGSAYECYFCHRTFRTLISLNTHLNSPSHDADEFMCPKCQQTYKLISGLIQHIESEICGLARFEQVEDHTNALTAQFARLLRF